MADATHYTEAPRRARRKGGIRSVAEFRDGGSRLGLGGIVEFSSTGCDIAVGNAVLCYPSGDPQVEKDRGGISTLEGVGPAFGTYVGAECWLGGDDYEQIARTNLLATEDHVIEAVLFAWVLDSDVTGYAATLSDAIAGADNTADGQYPYLPVIVMSRGDAVLAYADGALDGDKEGNLWTPNGTPVLASVEITPGTVYATGAITVLQGPVGVFRTQNLELNREFAIAERANALLVDCNFVAQFIVGEEPEPEPEPEPEDPEDP